MEKKTPRESFLRKKKNASGGVEAKFVSCKECAIEFCTGDSCKIFDYDSFKRIIVSTVQTTSEHAQEQTPQEKKPSKKKGLNKVSKVKERTSNMPARTKNVSRNNDNKIISVKTNVKNSNVIQDRVNDKSKDHVKKTMNISSKGNIQMKNNIRKKDTMR